MIHISKWNKKRLHWLKHHSVKMHIRKIKKKRRNKFSYSKNIYNSTGLKINKKSSKFFAKAPENLSIINNVKETYSYFNNIINELKKNIFKQLFYFDLKDVKELTIESVMYILAILRNIKGKDVLKYHFAGNEPINENARKLFVESGFFNYVYSRNPLLKKSSENIQITTGKNVDASIVGKICDFINTKFNTKLSFTDEIYEVLVELMTNAVQHAYAEEEVLKVNNWYIFVGELEKDCIHIVFLDTGLGIPQTVKKNFGEKVKELIFNKNLDSNYIQSALDGEFRTRTKKENRGKGLPSVKSYVYDNKDVDDFYIFSGYGCCKLNRNEKRGILNEDFDQKIYGTLFCWNIYNSNIDRGDINDKNKNF